MLYGLIASLVCNALCLVYIYRLRKPGKVSQPDLTKDASELLSDLMQGGAVVVTQVIDPSSMFLYSPKDTQ